ncbi:MAG: hypothetical protein HGGPFJEG_00527 [Ignavibacteria bacterium]|nr:hypothetical protein [Ignavibacteria bacterium]
MKYLYIIIPVIFFSIYSCTQKTDLSQFPISNNGGGTSVNDTLYVQQYPAWSQFNQPEAVLVGREPLVYVADTKNNRVVQLDLSGVEIGSISVYNPRALAQDYNFDLLVIGDSILTLTNDTISVLYRIKLVEIGGIISNAVLLPLIKSDYPTPLTSRKRRFNGIGVFSDNGYIVTRTGPDNTSSLDPDNALLKIHGINTVTSVENLSGFQVTGNGIYSIEKVYAITTFNNELTDFIITRNTTDFGFKIEWFLFNNTKGTYDPKFFPESDVDILSRAVGTPVGVCVDNNKNVYVVDNTYDSLYKFSSAGKFKNESFGGTGSGENQLRGPRGVSFFDKVLYIADTGNNRIVRYKLSTDLN